MFDRQKDELGCKISNRVLDINLSAARDASRRKVPEIQSMPQWPAWNDNVGVIKFEQRSMTGWVRKMKLENLSWRTFQYLATGNPVKALKSTLAVVVIGGVILAAHSLRQMAESKIWPWSTW
jgi:hypothetical protein